MKTNQKGFTLIELLIIIGIIAILAVAIVVSINPAKQFEAARNSTRWSHLNAIMTAIYTAAVANGGAFPSCVANATSTAVDVSTCDSTDSSVGIGDYIRTIPSDPQASGSLSCYTVQFNPTAQTVTVKPTNTGTGCTTVTDNITTPVAIELIQ